MKTKIWVIILLVGLLALAGCVDDGPKSMIDLRFDEGDSLAMRQGWYLEDGSCLLYGDYVGAKGRQGRLYWLDKPGEEPTCVWPQAGGWFDLNDELLAYYLPERQTAVLSNQTQRQFLLVELTPGKTYDTPQGNKKEIALPGVEAQEDLALCLWLGEGEYLLGRRAGAQAEDPLAVRLSIFDEAQGDDSPIFELPGRICDVKVDAERNRLLLLSNLGGLLALDLDGYGLESFYCVQAWPAPSPFKEYQGVWPVQAAEGDYLVLQSSCEDGIYYQVVDLEGGQLGVYKSEAEAGGGLLAAYGHVVYIAEYEMAEVVGVNFTPEITYDIMLFDFACGEAETINSGGYGGQPQENRDFPQRFGPTSGAISPDGKEMLWFCWEYVTKMYYFPDSLPLGGL